MPSLTLWTLVWVSSGSWWWTRKRGMLQSTGLQSQTRLSDWTELNWIELKVSLKESITSSKILVFKIKSFYCTLWHNFKNWFMRPLYQLGLITYLLPRFFHALDLNTFRVCLLSHVWLCNPMDHRPLGSSDYGIILASILEWVAISFSRGSSWCRDRTRVFCGTCTGRQILYHWATWEA